jgi:hypothetical protein
LLLPTLSLFVLSAVLAPSCGPDAPPLECPEPHPSFDVLIVAKDGPLPSDTLVTVAYGGGSEEYRADAPGPKQVVFCEPTTADGGALPPMGAGGESGAGGAGGEPSANANGGAPNSLGGGGGVGGETGATPHASALLEGIRCQLWTQGPATVTVDTNDVYETKVHPLRVSNTVCTVVETIEVAPPEDAGKLPD